jgi:hypothetical protein
MRSIIYDAASMAFDAFLLWFLIHYFYTVPYKTLTDRLEKKGSANMPSLQTKAYLLCIFIPLVLLIPVFLLRTKDIGVERGDYVYCTSGLFLMSISALFGAYRAFDDYKHRD